MKIFHSSSFWIFCFTIIFLLSLDFWSWQQDISFSLLYIPTWIFYFIGLQIILSLTLLFFSLKFWNTSSK